MQSKRCFPKLIMNKDIKHLGIIERIADKHIQVRIAQSSACASCKVASGCSIAESKEKIIDVYSPHQGYQIGQKVIVTTSEKTGFRAIALGFGIPLILLLLTLTAGRLTGLHDGGAALLAIFSLIPYYLIVRLFRQQIAQKITFRLESV